MFIILESHFIWVFYDIVNKLTSDDIVYILALYSLSPLLLSILSPFVAVFVMAICLYI